MPPQDRRCLSLKRKYSKLTHLFLGIAVIFSGIGILFDSLGLLNFHPGMLFPFFILYGGARFLSRGRRFIGTILIILGALFFLDVWLQIDAGEFIGFAFSFAMIYWGYRLIRNNKKQMELPPVVPNDQPKEQPVDQDIPPFQQNSCGYSIDTPPLKQSLIGNLYLTGSRWELKDMNIWHGIGDVKIDLSRALIHEKETVIMISGWIGDIDLYIPYDLDVSFIANVNMGDIHVFGNKQGGLNRSISLTTSGFHQATKRVRIVVTLLIGDIDMIYV